MEAHDQMTQLSGILEGVGLPAIVRFLAGLKKTGRLELDDGDWRGQVAFHQGEITDAVLGTRSGLAALEAMVEVLPGARFAFDSNASPAGEPSIRLGRDAVLAHIEEAAERCARGTRRLPGPQVVPSVVMSADDKGEEPLPLDRASLQTLLAVDGQRSVRQIVAERGSIDALWQLANLADVGLISLSPKAPHEATVASVPVGPAPVIPQPAVAVAEPVVAPEPARSVASALDAEPADEPDPAGHCPRLGFEDDPASSFGRPTRLHRCFAGATSFPLSLDQQRELCLTTGFGACPRLTPVQQPQPARAVDPRLRGVRPRPARIEASTGNDGRIVRLPTMAGREVPETGNAAAVDPTPIRSGSLAGRNPTPLRTRLERTPPIAAPATATAQTVPSAASAAAIATAPAEVRREVRRRPEAVVTEPEPQTRRGGISTGVAAQRPRILVGAVGIVALVLLAVGGYFALPQLSSVLAGDSVDSAELPNASRIAAGTPVTAIAGLRLTPIPASQPTVDVEPTVDPSAAVQTPRDEGQPTAVQSSTQPAAASPGAGLFDERFSTNDADWPSDPQGTALVTNGAYRIATRQAGQFAAISAPIVNVPADVVVNATFRKLAGPAGGGYGIIVRDQDPNGLDGASQDGHYYVLEAGDKGEIGIWRRDGDHWVDLLPWQHADTVKTGNASNDLSVRAVGNTLTLSVNGTQVATRTDATLGSGQVGLFVGGDGNQVAVSHFSIQAP